MRIVLNIVLFLGICNIIISKESFFIESCKENIKETRDTIDLSCINFFYKIETQKDTILSKEEIYKKIEEIVNLRIADKKEGKESLSYYFSKLNIEDISSYKIKTIIGRLIEFKYLKVRNSGEYDPESFPVYNLSISGDLFLLGIIRGDMSYTDFVCIDSIVLALDKIPQMQNDSIHKICLDLVKRNKTGGCKW